jgi:divalent metal cation (Fe/Co/Zn/Cd) transporter
MEERISRLQPEQGGSGAPVEKSRDQIIIRTSVIGILANFFLAGFKAVVGVLSHSIAIVLDAVNNLSDAASSLITIVGTKLAGRKPDKKHPFGHGRIEYLSAMIIAMIVLYAGITSLIEGVETEKQYRGLMEMGCELYQGYYFAKPMPLEDFERFAG